MNAPPLLTGSALIFWGWQTGFLPIAVIMALLFELPRLASVKLDVTREQLAKLWRLSSIIFMAAAVFAFIRYRTVESFLMFTTWLPLIFLPITLPLACKGDGRIDLDIFFVLLTKASLLRNRPITLHHPYLIICMAAASAANVRHIGFYAGLVILSAWALFPFRSKGYTPAFWLFLIILSAASGYAGAVGLNRLQGIVENAFIEWYVGSGRQDFDASRTKTAMGDMVELKRSNRIIMRVSGKGPHAIDYRLTKAAYNIYESSFWQAIEAPLLPVEQGEDNEYLLARGTATGKEVTVTASTYKGEALLSLPGRALALRSIPDIALSKSRLGTLSLKEGPAALDYRVLLGRDIYAGAPDERDLMVPGEEAEALSLVAGKLGLKSKSPQAVISSLHDFFRDNFQYSLDLKGSAAPIGDFLLGTRSGHCEYFASATTLLLRQAGIPARYNVGYVYNEFSDLEDMFIVRERNSHAWATAFVGGRWQVVDTTPSIWQDLDEAGASFWEPVTDIWSALSFLFAKWQREGGSMLNNRYSIAAVILLAAILLVKIRKGGMLIKKVAKEKKGTFPPSSGEGSPFYLIESALAGNGGTRKEGETYLSWLKRLEREGALPFPAGSVQALLALHNRWRFDPQGISVMEKSELEEGVALLLEKDKQIEEG
ncbi:MAG: transglutaminase-like domain-containing protein [bacterium]|nr:transglutaminase-like domain-containing protein [bacterium]